MKRFAILALVCSAVTLPAAASAKNDIRGVAAGQSLAEALETLDLDQAHCATPAPDNSVVCSYDLRTRMILYFDKAPPNPIVKLVYAFAFKDLTAMRQKLQRLYGLRADRIEGDHKLFTGERLVVELDPKGDGTLSIIKGAKARSR